MKPSTYFDLDACLVQILDCNDKCELQFTEVGPTVLVAPASWTLYPHLCWRHKRAVPRIEQVKY